MFRQNQAFTAETLDSQLSQMVHAASNKGVCVFIYVADTIQH